MDSSPVSEIAISSMNYFFMRIINGDIEHENVIEEVDLFLEGINHSRHTLSTRNLRDMYSEIIEGDYFDMNDLQGAEDKIRSAVNEIMDEPSEAVVNFYMDLIQNGEGL